MLYYYYTHFNKVIPYLNVLSLSLIIENMCNLLREDLLPPSTSMDTHHGHTNRPGGVTNRHGEVRIVCLDGLMRVY